MYANWFNIKRQTGSTYVHKLVQHMNTNWFNIRTQTGSTYEYKLVQHMNINWFNICTQTGSTYEHKLVQHKNTNWCLNWRGYVIMPLWSVFIFNYYFIRRD